MHRSARAQRSARGPPQRARGRRPWTRKTPPNPARHASRTRAGPAGTCSLLGLGVPALESLPPSGGWGSAGTRAQCAGGPSWAPLPAARCLWDQGPRRRRCSRARAAVKFGVRSAAAPGRGEQGRAPGARRRLKRAGRLEGPAGAGKCGPAGGGGRGVPGCAPRPLSWPVGPRGCTW